MSDIDPREAKLPAWAREQLAKARIGSFASISRIGGGRSERYRLGDR
ncbi:hypothetical protein PROPHIGD17-1_22 [Mycobacterium phage prophiGD17-1]|nr:hypothetical protein PHIGD17-1_61 [Mycobacterium phage phiGD17-1]QSM02734.1 hypothetical protein PROPHIGD17-1_22 [Mycobacterium phage prophiGD17-1]